MAIPWSVWDIPRHCWWNLRNRNSSGLMPDWNICHPRQTPEMTPNVGKYAMECLGGNTETSVCFGWKEWACRLLQCFEETAKGVTRAKCSWQTVPPKSRLKYMGRSVLRGLMGGL